ncbi:uncharacterized protein LOC131049313 isoform X2 [Cryptomeria japonica]|uniref:uncharacterized protein LOC131049313 isoform X2 n=1 Tax=Cryptomeria japonica TaxID=3369 RepID=UPI0025AC127B|nr:uncharacterized protein LOC131049313 isoform X2 [Cryptomeria japonica]
MNCKSGLADILRRLSSHFQEIEKGKCQVNGATRVGGLETSVGGGSLLNSQTSVNISLLNQSLNLSQRSPFLDAALSLMGYRVPHICNATTGFLVNTLISVLLSTITCKFLSKSSYGAMKENGANTSHDPFHVTWRKAAVGMISDSWPLLDQGFLQIGSFLSFNDFSKLLEACESIFRNLEAHGNLSSLLMDAILRVATSMTSFKVQFPLSSTTYKKFSKEKYSPLKLLNIFVKEEEVADQSLKSSIRGADRILEVCIELVAAIVDVILQPSAWGISVDDGVKLPISHAFFCLRQQPLLVALMRPLSYGNLLTIVDTLEDMQSLQLFDAYYSGAGTLPCIPTSVKGNSSSDWQSSENSSLVNHNSAWALLLEFPSWFHFASMILFKPENIECPNTEPGSRYQDAEQFHSNDDIQDVSGVQSSKRDSSDNAAKYLGWILSPIDAMHRSLVIRSLLQASKGWTIWRSKLLMSSRRKRIEECHSNEHDSFILNSKNKLKRKRSLFHSGNECGLDIKLKKPKVNAVKTDVLEMDINHGMEENDHVLMLWLDEFSDMCRKLWISPVISYSINTNACNVPRNYEGWDESESVGTSGKDESSNQNRSSDTWLKQYSFLRRIPFGLFLSNVDILDDKACHLLLHFVAADNDLALIPGSAVDAYQETKENPWPSAQTGPISTSSYGKNVKTDNYTEGPTLQTEISKDSTLWCSQIEGKTNWTRVTAVIFSLFDMIDSYYGLFQTVSGCQHFYSEVREKAGKFLVTCIKQILECPDFWDPRLLIDLRSRFASWIQQNEAICTEVSLHLDVLTSLDSKISSLQTNL